MPFKGPYPTVFGGNTPAMVISATTFDGGVTNVGTIGSGGISVIDSTFLSGGILDTGVITGGINIFSRSRIVGSGVSAVVIAATVTGAGSGWTVSSAAVRSAKASRSSFSPAARRSAARSPRAPSAFWSRGAL
jgi:hypothetical protein